MVGTREQGCGCASLDHAVSIAQSGPNPTAVLSCLQDKQLTKASFLAELRGKSAQQRRQAGGAAAAAQGSAPSEQAAAGDAPAWRALQDDMSSLQSGLRMKVGLRCCLGWHSVYSTQA